MNVSEIRQLYDYTEWANDLVLNSAQTLPADTLLKDVQISHKSILGTLTHMAGAESIWLERWHGKSSTGPDVWREWTTEGCRSVEELRAKWRPICEKRDLYIAGLQDADLPRELSFKRMNGDTYSMPLEDQMQHV